MEIKVIEEKKNTLVFEIEDESNSLCNVLKEELIKDSHVKIATYSIEHPLVGTPKMIVETDTSTSPKKALAGAVQRLKKQIDKFQTEFKKEVK